jgi:hypothetical protein
MDRPPNATTNAIDATQVSYSGRKTNLVVEPKDSGHTRKPKGERKHSAGNSRLELFLLKVKQSDPEYLNRDPDISQILEEFFQPTTTRYVPDEVDAKYSKNH